jgi:LytS/YehU family sensor histidine kinase
MDQKLLKNIIGFSLIISQMFCIFFVLNNFDDVDIKQKISIVLIISPVFGLYTIAVAKSFVENRRNTEIKETRLNLTFSLFSLLATFAFIFFILNSLISFKNKTIIDPEDLKLYLSISEVSFGAFLGLVIGSLFGSIKEVSGNDS